MLISLSKHLTEYRIQNIHTEYEKSLALRHSPYQRQKENVTLSA